MPLSNAATCANRASAASNDSACSKARCCAPNCVTGSDAKHTSRGGPAGTIDLNPLSVPTVAVVATQLLLPTVPAPALPYPAATPPQPAQVHQTLPASRGDAASSNYLLRLQPWNSLRFTSCSQRAWLQTREMEHSGCCSSVAARKKEASGYQHLYLAAGIHVAC